MSHTAKKIFWACPIRSRLLSGTSGATYNWLNLIGGACGRASSFCLSRPGLNPRTDIGFLTQNCHQSILSVSRTFHKKMCNRTMQTLPYSFMFPITNHKFIDFNLTMYQEKGKWNPKRGRERPTFKMSILLRLCFICQDVAALDPRIYSLWCWGVCPLDGKLRQHLAPCRCVKLQPSISYWIQDTQTV